MRIGEALERREAVLERVGRVVRADDDGDFGPVALPLAGERRVFERRCDGQRRGLQMTIAIDEAELPVDHGMAAAPPLVGPRERNRAGRAFFERGADVHRRDVRLPLLALTKAVGARFRQKQRLLTRNVLQPREVRAKLGLAMQVDVERADVEEGEIEEFRRRKVDVREEAERRRVLRVVVQVAQKALDARASVPAHDARRNFIAEREHQHGRMVAELSHPRADLPTNAAFQAAIVEKRHVLRPREPDHDAQAVPGRLVQEIASRRRVRPDRVDAESRHLAEVLGDLWKSRKLVAVAVGRKRAVGDAFDEEALVAGAQKLSVCRDARG